MQQFIQSNPTNGAQPTKYLALVAMGWISALLLTTLTTTKLTAIGPIETFAGLIVYPITYIFGDVFTEVYGYKNARRIIWVGLIILFVSAILTNLMVMMPPSPSYTDNEAFTKVFHQAPALAGVLMISYLVGEFSNSYIMARLKVMMKGRKLWVRTTSSTAVAQLIDNGIGAGLISLLMGYSGQVFLSVWLSTALLCMLYEFLATPLTYFIIGKLKQAEGMDIYDKNTNFNPFRWQ